MSPIPIIARQRALSRIGEIRCGDEKQNGRVGRKLETFRLTSQHREILDRAAELYGGEVKDWESPQGAAFQLVTKRAVLPVLVIPTYSLKRAYEKWDGPSKRVRLCDGEEEALSGQPCLCNAAGQDECKILTRLMVLLPETGTSLGWQLSSTGETAADELALAMKIAEGLAQGRPFVPGTLALTQRKGQLNGQATRFVVPVLGFDPQAPQLAAGELGAQGALSTPSERTALPSGYVPLTGNGGQGVTLEQGLAVAEQQTVTRTTRSAALIPAQDDLDFGDEPVSVATQSGAPALPPSEPAARLDVESAPQSPPDEKPLTLAQAKKKMNAIVAQLREQELITTEQLWRAVATSRFLPVDDMIALMDDSALQKGTPSPRDSEGVLHWSPLRDSLTLEEARALHGRLARLWANTQTEAAVGAVA